MKKWFSSALLTALLMVGTSVSALAQQMKPVVVASLASYDELIKDIAFLGKISDMPDLAQSVEGLIGFVTQFQGLAGLDKSNPIGVAVNTDGQQFQVIGFVPVSDVDKLLGALGGVLGEAEDAGDGCQRVKVRGFPLLIKQQGGWAFISYSKESFNNLPADPKTLLGKLDTDYDLGLRVYVQNVPEAYRMIGMQQLQAGMQQGMKRKPGESDEQFETRRRFAEQQMAALSDALNEMDELTVGVAIDSVEKYAYLDVGTSVLPDGKLAKQLVNLSKAKSKHAGFLAEDAVFNLNSSSVMSEADVGQLLGMLEGVKAEVKANIQKKVRNEQDQQKVLAWADELYDVVVATVKSGALSLGAVVVGDGPLTLAGGVTVVGSDRLEKVLKEAIALAESKPEFAQSGVKVNLNVKTHKDVRFHTISIPIPEQGKDADKAKELLGDDILLTFGYSPSNVYLALGQDGVKTLIQSIDDSAEPKETEYPFEANLALEPLLRLASKNEPDNEELALMAKTLAEGNDGITITTEIEGREQFMRVEIQQGVLRAFGLTVKAAAAKKGRR